MTMSRLGPIMALLLLAAPASGAPVYILTAAEWAGPKQGDRILNMDGVRSAVLSMDEHPGARLLLRYPGGDEGTLWVEELRSWLLALGVGPESIELRPGSPATDLIELEVLNGTGDY
ncbi:MAG: hypothetical protein HUJ29_13735 [Gammaproteobacteria bacterium]|nr:hypothetical protein [Gammaproteobacteria bacterium]